MGKPTFLLYFTRRNAKTENRTPGPPQYHATAIRAANCANCGQSARLLLLSNPISGPFIDLRCCKFVPCRCVFGIVSSKLYSSGAITIIARPRDVKRDMRTCELRRVRNVPLQSPRGCIDDTIVTPKPTYIQRASCY